MLRALPMRFLDWLNSARAVARSVLFLMLGAAPAFAQLPAPDQQDDELFGPTTRLSIAQGSGARAFGMGGAFIARPDDATAASWNPAGLSYLRRLEFSVAGLLTSARSIGTDGNRQVQADYRLKSMTADFISVAAPFGGERVNGGVQLSFQRAIPFVGERRIDRSRNRRIELDTKGGFDVIALGIGLQRSKSLRVGLTINHWLNGYEANFSTRPTNIEVRESDLSLSGWNMNAGVIWHPLRDDRLNVGVVGKTPFTANVSLWKRRKDFAPEFEIRFVDGQIIDEREKREFHTGLDLKFPASVGVGASWRITSPLTASVDYTRSFWSDASITGYFQLQPRGPAPVLPPLPFPDIGSRAGQADTQQIRAGLEYVFFVGRAKCPLRIGYFTDRQYFFSDDPLSDAPDDGPAPRFRAFTGGAGVAAGGFLFDVAYVREHGRYFDGLDYDTTTHRVFFSMIFRYAGRY